MAQTGYTPILIYSSSTTTNAPAAGNLTNSTLGSELAINITDGKLFYKDNANAIQVIAWKTTPTTAGGTGLTSYTAGDTLYYATGTTLSKLAIGTAYYMLGVNSGATAPSWQPSATSVLTTQGDLLYASAANTLARLAKNTSATRYLANSGTSNNPAWAQVDLTNGVTGVLPVANGGTNASSASITAFNNITGYTALGATGTTSTNLVFSGSPTITTPTLSGSSAIGATINGGINAGFIEYKGLNTGAEWLVGPLNSTNAFEWKNNTSDKYLLNLSNTGNLKIYEGNLVIGTSGKGIDFSVTSSGTGTMTSELFADYEEGTFTPTAVGSSSAGTGTYTEQTGVYTKIGRCVYVFIAINWTAHTGTGNLRIAGLPFSAAKNDVANMFANGLTYTGTHLQPFLVGTEIWLNQTSSNAADTYIPMDTNCQLGFTIMYYV